MDNFKLDLQETKPIFIQDFIIIYKGSDGIIEIKTSKEAFMQKLRYFYPKRNELFLVNEYFIHDKYETDIFKYFIESILNPVIIINKSNISNYYELSCKYDYLELKQKIEKFNEQRPDLLEIADQIFDIKEQYNEDQDEITSHKEELIAQNLDVCIRNGFLKKLPIIKLGRILNSPKRKIIDHRLLFNFVIDCIKNHCKNRTKSEEENLSILTCSLDYTKMSDNEINELLSFEQNMSIFHPINPEERMKTFIKESTKYQLKISELETMLKQLISKEEENKERISKLEQKLISNEEENKERISKLEQKLISNEEENKEKISKLEQKLISNEEENKERISKLEQKLVSKKEENKERISKLEQKLISEEEYMHIIFKKSDSNVLNNKYNEINEINVRSTDKISNILERNFSSYIFASYNGIILDPHLTLKDYFIQNNSTIYYFERAIGDNIIVFIKKNKNDYIPISIDRNSKVDDLMNKLSLQFIINDNELFYDNKKLNKGEYLQNYSISNKSIISISPSINTININFHVLQMKYQPISCITVNQTDEINVIEKKLNELFIRFPDQDIIYFYKGERLENNKTFQDYFITNNSFIVLYLKHKYIDISVLGDTIQIPENCSIKDSKMKIQEKTGIPWNFQKLYIDQKELYDYDYISFYSSESIRFFHFPEGSKLVYVEFDTHLGKVNDFIIYKDSLPVKMIWQKLHELAHLRYIEDGTLLMFDGQVLDENKILENYTSSINSGCKLTFTVSFMPRNRGNMQIFIKCLNGRHIPLYCEPTDRIEMIKYDLALATQIHSTRLLFAGKQLEDGDTLQDYSIQKDSTIHEVLRLRG